MKITIILFFEANTEGLVVQLAACGRFTDDRTKSRDEQYLDASQLFHACHTPMMNPAPPSDQPVLYWFQLDAKRPILIIEARRDQLAERGLHAHVVCRPTGR